MVERRALVEGIKNLDDVDPDLAEEFITNGKPRNDARTSPPPAETPQRIAEQPPALPRSLAAVAEVSSPLTGVGRVPVGARVRTELASAFKRASLERQLQGIQPNSIQDLLEEAMELWLHKHGLLK